MNLSRNLKKSNLDYSEKFEQSWHSFPIAKVFAHLNSNQDKGLSSKEVKNRQKQYGFNAIPAVEQRTILQIFLVQFKNLPIILLLIASLLSFFLGRTIEGIVIFAVIFMTVIFGFIMERSAQRAIGSLIDLRSPKAKVLRDGYELEIDAHYLVPGDIIEFESGDKVPADCRLTESFDLTVDESPLTGESHAVRKNYESILKENLELAERTNICYMGTLILEGRAKGIVIKTGKFTEVGKIGELLQGVSEGKTPLEKKIENLSKILVIAVFAITVLYIAIGYLHGFPIGDILLSGIVLAIAAVPEGLPAVATITLALGIKRMAKNYALIRRLASAETLGSVSVICTDKTGTLTKNEPTLREIMFFNNSHEEIVTITGDGFVPHGKILYSSENNSNIDYNNSINKNKNNSIESDASFLLILQAGTLCNNAELSQDSNRWLIHGDTTEGSIIVASSKAGLDKKKLEQEFKRIWEDPFDPNTRRMTTIHKTSAGKIIGFVKGASESLMPICSKTRVNQDIKPMNDARISQINQYIARVTKKSYRTLAIAYKEFDGELEDYGKYINDDFIFLGIAGIYDPPRKEVKESIKFIKNANVQVVLITGDHPLTAKAIGKELDILDKDRDKVITGNELEKISIDRLSKEIEHISVFARSTPYHKLKIVKALQRKGHIVGMTGDGVNDAPALKQADIGVVMGKKGTDVAKESTELILLDDNFATITHAIRIGRLIFSNIKKFVKYLFSCNISEVLTMLIAVIIALPFPLLPLQLLWMNLTINTFPALALSAEKENKHSIKQRPPTKREPMISRKEWFNICIQALFMAIATIGVFMWALSNLENEKAAQTMAFATLSIIQTFHVLNYSSLLKNLFKKTETINKPLVGAIILSSSLLFLAIYTPQLSNILELHLLDFFDWTIILIVSVICILLIRLVIFFFNNN